MKAHHTHHLPLRAVSTIESRHGAASLWPAGRRAGAGDGGVWGRGRGRCRGGGGHPLGQAVRLAMTGRGRRTGNA